MIIVPSSIHMADKKVKKWNIFGRSSKSKPDPPPEYLCPICHSLISDPVVLSSGHSVDRLCVEVCRDLNFNPVLPDGTRPDLYTKLIPNLSLQKAIANWCTQNGVGLPRQKDCPEVEMIVKGLIEKERERELINGVSHRIDLDATHPVTELNPRVDPFGLDSSSSTEFGATPMTPLAFKRKPTSWSSSSSEQPSSSYSSETLSPNTEEEEELIALLESSDPSEQEKAAISLRNSTRTDENDRTTLCTPRLLTALRSLLNSSYENVQMNAVAALVNLSLENSNKVKIVRSGIVPTVIALLKGRSSESQEHAAGVIFSLSLNDDNKTTLGFLGSLPPLMYCLTRSDSARTRSDSALALYHLTLVYTNRVKLVKQGAVPALLAALTAEENVGRVLLVVCNVAASAEGKAAMLDSNAAEILVNLLRRSELRDESTRENCVAALYEIGRGKSVRFRAMAKAAGVAEVLKEVAGGGSERARDKARRVLFMLKGMNNVGLDEEEEDEEDLPVIGEAGGIGLQRHRFGFSAVTSAPGVGRSSEF